MDIQELKNKLMEIGVPNYYYSINGNISSDTYILNKVYNYWEFFYLDERGGRNDYQRFDNERDACVYMFEALKKEIEY